MNKKSCILIVDDDPITTRILSVSLKNDYEIVCAENGNEAIKRCKEVKPDLILMDVMMPLMNGYDACKAIKNNCDFNDVPIIFLTSEDNPEKERQGLEAGGIDYLTKPIDMTLLRIRVSNHLEMKKKSDLLKKQRDMLAAQKTELEAALIRIKRLEGIIPICMYCKSIRNDENSWERMEEYIERHSDTRFSHGICDTCKADHFPGKPKK